jgi:hypothetical protein
VPAAPDDWRRTGQEDTLKGVRLERRPYAPPSQEGLRAWRSPSKEIVAESFGSPPPGLADDWEEIEPRHGWDHDHCAFCWAKFMPAEAKPKDPQTLTDGYVSEAGEWICDRCFADFRDEFEWIVEGTGRG